MRGANGDLQVDPKTCVLAARRAAVQVETKANDEGLWPISPWNPVQSGSEPNGRGKTTSPF